MAAVTERVEYFGGFISRKAFAIKPDLYSHITLSETWTTRGAGVGIITTLVVPDDHTAILRIGYTHTNKGGVRSVDLNVFPPIILDQNAINAERIRLGNFFRRRVFGFSSFL
jgi:hypothetical protein